MDILAIYNVLWDNYVIVKRYLTKVFIEHFAFGLTLSVSVIWMLSQGISLPVVALIESVALAIGLFIDIPTGYISDKLGRKFTLVSANVFHTVGFLIFAFSNEPWQFLVAAIIQAIGFALMSGSEEAYIYESKPGDYRKAFSNVNVVDEGATILGLLCAPLLISWFSLQSVFLIAALVVFAGALVSFFLLKDNPKQVHSELKQRKKAKLRFIGLIRKHAPLLILFIILAVYYEGGRVFWQPQLTASGFNIEQLGFLFAAFKVASLVGAYVGRHQKLSLKREMVGIGLLLTASFLLIASSVQHLVLVGFFLYFFLENIYRIVESNYLQSLIDDKRRATFLSAASFTRQGYSIIAIPVLGFVAVADLSYVFYLLAITQLFAALLFWAFAYRISKPS
jgi:MFS family permease